MELVDKRAFLAPRICRDLVARSRHAVWAHPLCVFLVIATSRMFDRAPHLAYSLALCSAFVDAFRGLCVWASTRRKQDLNAHWHTIHTAVLLCSAATWGVFPALAIWRFGFQDKDVLTLLLFHAAISFGTINLLIHDFRVMFTAIALLFVPHILGGLLSLDRLSHRSAGAPMLFLLYCVAQGQQLHKMYARQLEDEFELSIAAYKDCLTGLPNRLYLSKMLAQAVRESQHTGERLALLYIDLDGFKEVNDQHSHEMGDLFLCEAARRIRERLPPNSIVARIGGDEFTVLLPACSSPALALNIAELVLENARIPMFIRGCRLDYSASIGLSVLPECALEQDEFMRSADEAMYRAKRSGKNRICFAQERNQQVGTFLDLPLWIVASATAKSEINKWST